MAGPLGYEENSSLNSYSTPGFEMQVVQYGNALCMKALRCRHVDDEYVLTGNDFESLTLLENAQHAFIFSNINYAALQMLKYEATALMKLQEAAQ